MSDQEDPAATSSPLDTKLTESYQPSTAFRQEPPFTNEDDRETIESYYSYLKDEAARVPPTQVLHHLETKVPLNHKCEFNELFTYFRSKQTYIYIYIYLNASIAPPIKQEDIPYSDFILRCCSAEEVENTSHHVLKFQSRGVVNPMKFNKPVRLHRKDPRNLQFQLTRKEIDELKRERAKNGEEAPAAKSQEDIQMEEAEAGAIAPDGGARSAKKNMFKRRVRQVKAIDEAKKKLRFEEYYPWVLEDYDGSSTYVGNYEAGSSDSYALFVFDRDGFKMIPADKVYRFTPRNRYATLTLEEAEAKMENSGKVPRWLMRHMEDENQTQEAVDSRFRRQKMRTVAGGAQNKALDEADLDFEEDFADDEEAPIQESVEDNKESERRMRQEMLRASNLQAEDNGDDDLFDELFESKKVDKEGKKLKKTLMKTERNDVYESDEEANPYLSESEEESDHQQDHQTREKMEEDAKEQEELREAERALKKKPYPAPVKRIQVKSYRDGVVSIKAIPELLQEFPDGEWNPQVQKRSLSQDQIKREGDAAIPSVKTEQFEGIPPQSDLLTEEEIVAIVSSGPISMKQLIASVKPSFKRNPENKERLKVLGRKLLRAENGFLYLKDSPR